MNWITWILGSKKESVSCHAMDSAAAPDGIVVVTQPIVMSAMYGPLTYLKACEQLSKIRYWRNPRCLTSGTDLSVSGLLEIAQTLMPSFQKR